jgi:hypothetical protein
MLHNAKHFEKIRAVAVTWPEIVKIPAQPKGTRFLLRYNASKHPFLENKGLQ